MQWMVPHNKLKEEQTYVLDRCLRDENKCVWIRGFAGSGKSIVLIHHIIEFKKKAGKSACIVVYTHALKDLLRTGLPDHLRNIPVMTYFQFKKAPKYYDLIVVDEVQDLEEGVLRMLHQYSGKLIVAGDEDQSIYEGRVSANDIDGIIAPETHKLVVLYRLTEKIRDIVRTILPNSLIHSARNGRFVSVDVTLAHAQSKRDEIQWVWKNAIKGTKQGDPTAILLPNQKLIKRFVNIVCEMENVPQPSYENNEYGRVNYDTVNQHLETANLALRYLGNDFGSLEESDLCPIVYLMTYHSAKGLDFNTVFLPHLGDGLEIWRDDDNLSRRLFFVATTRSRLNLFMSHHSTQPHEYVRNMPQDLLMKIECAVKEENSSNNDFEFIF